MKRIRVLLADDHPLILEGLKAILASQFELLEAVRDGKSLVAAALLLEPDVVLLDVSLPMLSGIDAARQIKRAVPKTHLIFVTMHANPTFLKEALAAGAAGYVLKTAAGEELLEAIRSVTCGGTYVTSGFCGNSLDSGSYPAEKFTDVLTSRQKQILQLVAEGHTAKEISTILHISVQTVAFHKHCIMDKLGLRSTAALTKYAVKSGLSQI